MEEKKLKSRTLAEEKRFVHWQIAIFVLCWLAYAFTYMGRMNLSVALNAIGQEFGSTKAMIGLIGSLYLWAYAIGKLVNGYLGDYVNNKIIVFIGLVISAACNVAVGFADNIWMVTLLWSVNAFAQSALWCNIVRMVSNWYPLNKQASIVVWLSTSSVFGSLLALGGSGWIIQRLPWRFVFIIPGIVLGGVAVVWLIFAKNRALNIGVFDIANERAQAKQERKNMPKQSIVAFILGSGLLLVTLASLAQGVIKDGIGLWGPTMFADSFEIDAATASFVMLFIPVMSLFGISLSGLVQKKMKNDAGKAAMLLMLIGAVTLIGLRLFMAKSLIGGVLWLGIASAAMYGVNTILLGVFPLQYVAEGRVSFVSGFLDFTSYIAAGASSIFIGFVLDKGLGWNTVFMGWLVLIIVGIGALVAKRLSDKNKS